MVEKGDYEVFLHAPPKKNLAEKGKVLLSSLMCYTFVLF